MAAMFVCNFSEKWGEAVKKISHFVEKTFFRKSKKNLSIFPACGIFPLSPRATPSHDHHHHHHHEAQREQDRASHQRNIHHWRNRSRYGSKSRWSRLQLHACAGNRRRGNHHEGKRECFQC